MTSSQQAYVDAELDAIDALVDAAGGYNTEESVERQYALAAWIEARS